MNPALELAALLAGGSIALAAHGTKATTRLAINASPEPFSNWAASVTEDLAVLGGIWMIFNHPIVMMILVASFRRAGEFGSCRNFFAWPSAASRRCATSMRGVKPDQTGAHDGSPPAAGEF